MPQNPSQTTVRSMSVDRNVVKSKCLCRTLARLENSLGHSHSTLFRRNMFPDDPDEGHQLKGAFPSLQTLLEFLRAGTLLSPWKLVRRHFSRSTDLHQDLIRIS